MRRCILLLLIFFGLLTILEPNIALAGCYSDFDCGFGNKCVKPAGGISIDGVCVTPSDQFGNPRHSYDAPKSRPREVERCSFDTDCSIGFSCMKRSGEIYGICVK